MNDGTEGAAPTLDDLGAAYGDGYRSARWLEVWARSPIEDGPERWAWEDGRSAGVRDVRSVDQLRSHLVSAVVREVEGLDSPRWLGDR